MNLPLRCHCGSLQGQVDTHHAYGRAACYCRDCQAYAKFLGREADVLNPQGGTEIVAMLPACVRFTAGDEHLACMSLSPGGILRWYAACCRTPIGNTPRNPKVAYLGLLPACLPCSSKELEHAFGPSKIALNTAAARGKVSATPLATTLGVVRIMKNVLGARLSGRYRASPFFHAESGTPVRQVQVLTAAQRQAMGANPGRPGTNPAA